MVLKVCGCMKITSKFDVVNDKNDVDFETVHICSLVIIMKS